MYDRLASRVLKKEPFRAGRNWVSRKHRPRKHRPQTADLCVFEVCVFEVCGLWSVFSRSVFSRHPVGIGYVLIVRIPELERTLPIYFFTYLLPFNACWHEGHQTRETSIWSNIFITVPFAPRIVPIHSNRLSPDGQAETTLSGFFQIENTN